MTRSRSAVFTPMLVVPVAAVLVAAAPGAATAPGAPEGGPRLTLLEAIARATTHAQGETLVEAEFGAPADGGLFEAAFIGDAGIQVVRLDPDTGRVRSRQIRQLDGEQLEEAHAMRRRAAALRVSPSSAVAIAHARLGRGSPESIEFEAVDGVLQYEVSIADGERIVEYQVDAHTGAVLRSMTLTRAGVRPATRANFDSETPGQPPEGWRSADADGGGAVWSVVADPTAPSAPSALAITRVGDSSGDGIVLLALDSEAIADGSVDARVQARSGDGATGAGVGFRLQPDGDGYVAIIDPAAGTARLVVVRGGAVSTLAEARTGTGLDAWHAVRVEMSGPSLRLLLDGRPVAEALDGTFVRGTVGFAAPAGALARFDDLVAMPSTRSRSSAAAPAGD